MQFEVTDSLIEAFELAKKVYRKDESTRILLELENKRIRIVVTNGVSVLKIELRHINLMLPEMIALHLDYIEFYKLASELIEYRRKQRKRKALLNLTAEFTNSRFSIVIEGSETSLYVLHPQFPNWRGIRCTEEYWVDVDYNLFVSAVHHVLTDISSNQVKLLKRGELLALVRSDGVEATLKCYSTIEKPIDLTFSAPELLGRLRVFRTDKLRIGISDAPTIPVVFDINTRKWDINSIEYIVLARNNDNLRRFRKEVTELANSNK